MRFAIGGLAIGLFSVWGLAQLEAAPLDFKQVAGDAKWVGHVDVDAMRESKVVQNAYHRAQEKHPHMAMGFEFGSKMLGMDVRSDLHGITVYGKEVGKETGVMLVNAKVDRENFRHWPTKHAITRSKTTATTNCTRGRKSTTTRPRPSPARSTRTESFLPTAWSAEGCDQCARWQIVRRQRQQ